MPELAETVLAEDLRVQQLVGDLLLLARTDETSASGPTQVVDLDDVVLAHARRVRAPGRLRVDTTGLSAGRVRGHPDQLGRAVGNLVDNAVRHARTRVTLTLATDPVGRQVVLQVEDEGPGISVGDRLRVFERFVRLDEARSRDHGGSGLGLAIVDDVVRAHAGTVRVTDGSDGGARFEVCLPAYD